MTDNAEDGRRVDHFITIQSTQIYEGHVTPEEAEFLTNDGTAFDGATGREVGGRGIGLEFVREAKLTYECSCGKTFRKGRTAREHLETFRGDSNA